MAADSADAVLIGRTATTDEVAAFVAFPLGDGVPFAAGAETTLDGGSTAS
ncbi:hypothetical protein [Pseudonocardia endophytica]|nr:hypothetical protein [Pseudonocardia endophytica]